MERGYFFVLLLVFNLGLFYLIVGGSPPLLGVVDNFLLFCNFRGARLLVAIVLGQVLEKALVGLIAINRDVRLHRGFNNSGGLNRPVAGAVLLGLLPQLHLVGFRPVQPQTELLKITFVRNLHAIQLLNQTRIILQILTFPIYKN